MGFTKVQVTTSLLNFRTLQGILADLNCTVVCIVSILSLISSYSSLFSKFIEIVPSAPTTFGITVAFMVHKLLRAQGRYLSRYLFYLSPFIFSLSSVKTSMYTSWYVLLFFWINSRSGILAGVDRFVCVPIVFLCLIFNDRFKHITFVIIGNLQFLSLFVVNHFPQPVIPTPEFFPTSFLYSLIIGLTVPSFSLHNLYLLFP